MRTLPLLLGLAGLGLPAWSLAADPPKFAFQDGDRVVLIGDSLIEDDQKYGYLETLLTLLNTDKTITFRNLGWSGDTVYGHARAGFGTQADGFKHLKEHVIALKPTVLIVGYGMTESFDGEAGLPKFVSGLNVLLDAVAPSETRLIFLSPIAHLDLGRPLPDPVAHNRSLARYAEAIRKVAEERHGTFVDLFEHTSRWNEEPRIPGGLKLHSADGIHLKAFGYWGLALGISHDLGLIQGGWHHDILIEKDGSFKKLERSRAEVSQIMSNDRGMTFHERDEILPPPPPPVPASQAPWLPTQHVRSLQVAGLADGTYTLKVDGKSIATATESDWSRGVHLRPDAEQDQIEALRRAINEKNRLYFYRWRPQNETYLFGFRKHEQGNNAREIPLFDPLVDAKEKEIAKLRVPAAHVYELTRESEESK